MQRKGIFSMWDDSFLSRVEESSNFFVKNIKESIPKRLVHKVRVNTFRGGHSPLCAIQLGEESASKLLLVTSGLHGVEGRAGLWLKLRTLEELCRYHQPDIRVVLLCAVNRSGFLTSRRAGEENADLNRSFLDCNPYQDTHPAWDELYRLLGPKSQRINVNRFTLSLVKLLAKHGKALFNVFPLGQSKYSDLVFHSHSAGLKQVKAIERCVDEFALGARSLLHLDVHSGLGKWGELALLSPSHKILENIYSTQECYDSPGGFSRWVCGTYPHKKAMGAVAEFGTYSSLRVFFGLLQENQSFHLGHKTLNFQHRKRLLELFFPQGSQWRKAVLSHYRKMILNSLRSCAVLSEPLSFTQDSHFAGQG